MPSFKLNLYEITTIAASSLNKLAIFAGFANLLFLYINPLDLGQGSVPICLWLPHITIILSLLLEREIQSSKENDEVLSHTLNARACVWHMHIYTIRISNGKMTFLERNLWGEKYGIAYDKNIFIHKNHPANKVFSKSTLSESLWGALQQAQCAVPQK